MWAYAGYASPGAQRQPEPGTAVMQLTRECADGTSLVHGCELLRATDWMRLLEPAHSGAKSREGDHGRSEPSCAGGHRSGKLCTNLHELGENFKN